MDARDDRRSEPLRLAIVLEWENVHLAGESRCLRMLDSLAEQLERGLEAPEGEGALRLAAPVQLVVVGDPAHIAGARPEALVRDRLARIGDRLDLALLAVEGSPYYELKNEGVKAAAGEVVVLLDSDVIPEGDWLERLLEPFADPAVRVVGSNSYVEPTSTWARAFALGWLFPLRSEDAPLERAERFYSNSVAFRTEVLRSHPFPALPGASRGAGSLLARELQRSGIPIHRCSRARVAHPAPRPTNFVRRALAQGRDTLLSNRARSASGEAPVDTSWRRVRDRARRAWRRIARMGDRVGLKRWEIPPALAIMTLYYALFFTGDLLTRIAPGFMARRFRL